MNCLPAAALSLASLAPRASAAFRPSRLAPIALRLRSSVGLPSSSSLAAYRIDRRRLFSASGSRGLAGADGNMGDAGDAVYWNRETSEPGTARGGPIVREARILALCDPDDSYNEPLYSGPLPEGAELLRVGASLSDFDDESVSERRPNVIFVSHPKARGPLVELLERFPSVEWVHTRSAGIDFVASEGLFRSDVALTNAKGMFSSTLAEYCMMACSYFAKDLPRLMRQKDDVNWEQYPVLELRGATLGVVGYGDIGKASARLAKAYGMRVLGLKRNPAAFSDPHCDEVFGTERLGDMLAESDYVLVSAPLTDATRGVISREALARCKPSAVIINVGRGPIVDEGALIDALRGGVIKGAGLDVMTVEPLPEESPLWKLDNVLLSPHNMDMTQTFMKESTEFFVKENLPRFMRGERLLNPVDKEAGY